MLEGPVPGGCAGPPEEEELGMINVRSFVQDPNINDKQKMETAKYLNTPQRCVGTFQSMLWQGYEKVKPLPVSCQYLK